VEILKTVTYSSRFYQTLTRFWECSCPVCCDPPYTCWCWCYTL